MQFFLEKKTLFFIIVLLNNKYCPKIMSRILNNRGKASRKPFPPEKFFFHESKDVVNNLTSHYQNRLNG